MHLDPERDVERLGDSLEFGSLLLETLSAHGWTVTVQSAFGGGIVDEDVAGVLVIASKNGHEVRGVGRSIADVAGEIFAEATRVQAIAA